MLTGGDAGFVANFPVRAFGVIPLNPDGWGSETLRRLTEAIHEIAFDALVILIVPHGAFHIWRHARLRDNALRIVVPRASHKDL